MKDYDLILLIAAGILFFTGIFIGTIQFVGKVFKPVPKVENTMPPQRKKEYKAHIEQTKHDYERFRNRQKQILRDYRR